MAIHNSNFELHKEALQETLEAISLLLNYRKADHPTWNDSKGCLGYPTAILLFSFINTIGALFEGEIIEGRKINNDKSTFQILNSSYFGNQNLSTEILDDLYEVYRSKLTHNHSLPLNYYLNEKSENANWYEKTSNNKGVNIITTIYLIDLLNLCKESLIKIKSEHEKFYQKSQNIKNLDFKNISNNPTLQSFNSSGVTN